MTRPVIESDRTMPAAIAMVLAVAIMAGAVLIGACTGRLK